MAPKSVVGEEEVASAKIVGPVVEFVDVDRRVGGEDTAGDGNGAVGGNRVESGMRLDVVGEAIDNVEGCEIGGSRRGGGVGQVCGGGRVGWIKAVVGGVVRGDGESGEETGIVEERDEGGDKQSCTVHFFLRQKKGHSTVHCRVGREKGKPWRLWGIDSIQEHKQQP